MGCAASTNSKAQVEPERQPQNESGSPLEKSKDKVLTNGKLEEAGSKANSGTSRPPPKNGSASGQSAELTHVQSFDLRTVHSIVERRKPEGSRALPAVDGGMGATVSPIVRGAALLPVEGRRASQSPAVRKRGSADGSGTNRIFSPSKHGSADGAASSPLPGSPMLGSRPLAGNASRAAGQLAPLQGGPGQPIYRMSGAATGALSGGAGSNVSSILKSNSKEAGSRSVKAPGMRSIAFKDAAKTTFVFDRGEDDDLLDDDYYSDDEGGKSFVVGNVNSRLRLHSLVPTGRLDSMADGGLDLAAGLSSRAGSVALLAKKPLLVPARNFRSADSTTSQVTVSNGLPPVKPTGHRSIGSRSIGGNRSMGGVRSEVSFAVSMRDVATPALKNRSGPSVSIARGESAASSFGGSFDSAATGDRHHLSRGGTDVDPDDPANGGSGADRDDDPGRYSRKIKRGGKEWDAKGARWRRASVFQSSAHCAISLGFLRKLLTEHVVPLAHKLKLPLGQVTTSMVNEMVVKELTKEDQCRLVDVPGLVPVGDVGEPDYFISHAWGNPFAHLVQCVCDHLSGALDSTKVWIDIAAVNQHPTEQQQDDLANLRNAIYKSKATLMCLDVTGAPLKRVWCLYECDNTITIHGPDRLVLLTPNFSVKDMASVFKSINVTEAGAYKQSDKDKILEDIVAHHGSATAFDNKLKLLFLLEPLDTQAELESLLEGTGGATEYDFSPIQLWITSPRAPQVCVLSGPAGSGKSTISAALCWDEEAQQRRQKAIAKGNSDTAKAIAEADAAAAAVAAPHGVKVPRLPGASASPENTGSGERRTSPKTSGSGAQPPSPGGGAGGGGGKPPPFLPMPSLTRQLSGLASGHKPLVHAYHFCKYSDVRRQSPIRIVKTLAYQLAQRMPLLRNYYASLDLGQVQQLHQASTAFRLLLLKPLTTLMPRDEQVVLLIDAMDEADSQSQLPLDNPVLQLMLHQLSSLPRNVRIVTSTRSAPHLMGPLRRKFQGALELTPAMVRKRESTLAQLERRVCSRFGANVAGAVMSHSGGENNLVYFSAVMLLEPPMAEVPASLPACYNMIFSAQWPKLSKQEQQESIKALQVLMAAREPLQLSLLAGLGLDQVLAKLPGWGALMYEREYKVYTLHKSLHDWLMDKEASGPYYADARVGHATLGRYLFHAAHPRPAYGAKYLVTHLLAAGAKLKELLDQAITDMDHLEACCRVGHVFRLHAELAAAEPKSRAVADVVRWLGLNSHVLWAHPAAVVQLANEAPNTSAFMVALRRPRRSSTITTELMAAAAGAVGGGMLQPNTQTPVTLLNKRRSWPAQLSILAQHHRAVNGVCFNPAGTLLGSGSEDKSVRLWDPLTGEQKAVLFGHTGQVLSVAFSPNGALLASASVDSTVRLWDAATGEEKGELFGHVDWVRDVAFGPPATPGGPAVLLASCGDDTTVKLWDVGSAMPALKFSCGGHTDIVHSVVFSREGTLLASGSADMSIRLWDSTTGRQSGKALVAHKFAVTSVAFSPDGKTLASASHDKMIFLWDLESCRESGQPVAELTGHMDKVLSTQFSPDGALLVSASGDGSLRLWDVASRKVHGVLLGHASGVVAASFSRDGALVASAASDNTVRLWDPKIACEGKSVEEASLSHMDCVTCVAFSPSGHTVASAGQDWTVRLWDPTDGNHRALLQGHTDVVRCVAFSPTGHLLASASSDWTVRLWDPVTGAEKGLLQAHQDRVLAVTFAPNSRFLASACHSGTIVIWDAIGLDPKHTLRGHAAPVHSLAFSPNSRSLASGSADKTVRVWHSTLGEQQVLIKGHTGGVTTVEYDPTGKLLASSSLDEKSVRVWDPASGTLLCIISNAGLCAAGAFSMYSLARHAPCVRAIALQPRPAGANTSMSGAAAGFVGTAGAGGAISSSGGGVVGVGEKASLSGGLGSAAFTFGRQPSFTPHNMLQPSMTMRLERNSPNGLIIGPGGSSTEYNYNFVINNMGMPSLGGSGGGAPPSPGGTPPVLQTAMSMRSSLSSMDEIPRLMELVNESDNPIVPIYTQFVSPRCVAVSGNKVVMSDGPHIYFFESNEGKIVGWRSRIQSAAS
ncbi:hypothetical protein CHLRE_12g512750v5 [Chlamydomonas reinhardtii]|uniref:Nephrocystin 3-like N-terminal domain-containing protein n=1 Tax=Chlamydomonas reinhardtii TaxID=3055 RepID=A0A2K3D2G4_CHLRE|nr:uncharacterized protein CHLRE_12g512750v5 [Chlamydomonas reinhardtii]PNW74724.1 hypothetical protein CHLRE_12g512750v5 [Chlamydomonas reinhardtii]